MLPSTTALSTSTSGSEPSTSAIEDVRACSAVSLKSNDPSQGNEPYGGAMGGAGTIDAVTTRSFAPCSRASSYAQRSARWLPSDPSMPTTISRPAAHPALTISEHDSS